MAGPQNLMDSAAACCESCRAHRNHTMAERGCNVWVWCGDASTPNSNPNPDPSPSPNSDADANCLTLTLTLNQVRRCRRLRRQLSPLLAEAAAGANDSTGRQRAGQTGTVDERCVGRGGGGGGRATRGGTATALGRGGCGAGTIQP